MNIRCVWEHNGNDTMMYSDNFIGAFTRGKTKEIALSKMQDEIKSYLEWAGEIIPASLAIELVQENESTLHISDADSDILFDTERPMLFKSEYNQLKKLALKSAHDFLKLYHSVPDKTKSCLSNRKTFYGDIPRTAKEMYIHTKNVNSYYFGEIGVEVDNEGTIFQCREKGFTLLEEKNDYLNNDVIIGSYEELWSLRKVLRRFIWHDRIHAKAMYKMAMQTFGKESVYNIFKFQMK